MLRFYGADLKSVVTESISRNKPVMLIKDNGIYLMVEDGGIAEGSRLRHQIYQAFAEGCNPACDLEWQTMTRLLISEEIFSERLCLTEGQRWDIIIKSLQLVIVQDDISPKVFTDDPDYVPVAKYRSLTNRMNTMAIAHFNACVGPGEYIQWREAAYRLFWKCKHIRCKRAKRGDHFDFITAVNLLHRRARSVSPTGALLFVTN
ncbi:hypothetical protein [Erwinia sp. OPT-41]|uniref:DUF3085 domain-containing protein n=1 Tax=Erwinia plantamica TaxID=3237104 RepID=A0ABW7CKZ0_9GAMM